MTAPTDPRAVVEFRVPAGELKAGDLVNTAPGEGDWQQVTAVYRSAGDAAPSDAAPSDALPSDALPSDALPSDAAPSDAVRRLVKSLGGRYVVVELTDLLPVDGGIYFSDGLAMVAGDDDEGADQAVTDAVSDEDGQRVYLYTKFELVTVRSARV